MCRLGEFFMSLFFPLFQIVACMDVYAIVFMFGYVFTLSCVLSSVIFLFSYCVQVFYISVLWVAISPNVVYAVVYLMVFGRGLPCNFYFF